MFVSKLRYFEPSFYVIFCKISKKFALFHSINKKILSVSEAQFNYAKDLFKKRRVFLPFRQANAKNKFLKKLAGSGFLVTDSEMEKRAVFSILKSQLVIPPRINTLYILPTIDCNFCCDYCFIKKNSCDKSSLMDGSVLKKGLDFFTKNCVKNKEKFIIFYGGEPLLHYHFVKNAIERIRYMERRGSFGRGSVTIGINTNGSLLSQDKIDFLKKNRCFASISLDGSKKTNDRARHTVRGKGTFDQTAIAIDKAQSCGLPVEISLTVGRHNVTNLSKDVKYLNNRFGHPSFGFNFMFDFFREPNTLSVPDNILMKKLRKFYGSLESSGIYENKFFRKRECFLKPKACFNHCNAYGRQVVLLPGGEIGPCHAFAGTSMYFTKLKPKMDIKNDPVWRAWGNRYVFKDEKCRQCKLVLFCGGGCAYNSYVSHHDINGIDELNCKLTRLFVMEYISAYLRSHDGKGQKGLRNEL